MTIIVTVKGRPGDRLEVNQQDKGELHEDGILVDVDEGENTFSAYEGDGLIKEITQDIFDVGNEIVIDLRP